MPDTASSHGILQLLQMRARGLAWRLAAQFDQHVGKSFDAALNECAVIAVQASTAHVQQFMYENNLKAIEVYFKDNVEITTVMTRLLHLHGLQVISEYSGDFIGVPTMTSGVILAVERRINTLMDAIRPDAVGLVDSFGFLDTQLKSTLGRYDGNVYEAIVEEASKNPLNGEKGKDGGKMIGWHSFSKVLNLKFLEQTAKGQHQRNVVAKL